MSRYTPQPISLLGLNEDENPLALRRGELQVARNSWRRGSSRGTRPGLQRDVLMGYTDTAGQGGAINGLVDYRFANDTSQFLVCVANGNVFSDDGTSIKNGGTTVSAGSNNRWTFAQHKGSLYAAGGTGTDNFWSWNGSGTTSNISMVDLSAGAIYPSYVFEKWNFGFTAGFRNSAGALATDLSSGPMTVRYSDLNDMTTWPTASTFGGTSSVGGFSAYGDEYLTGFGEFSNNAGDWLLVLSNKRLYPVAQVGDPDTPFYTPPNGIVMNGCVHQNAYVSLGLDSGDSVYLSRTGIHSVRMSEQFGERTDKFLSWKIRQTFAGLNQSALHRSVAAFDPKRGIVLFAVPFGSSSNPDMILCLDVKNQATLSAETAEWDIWHISDELAANDRTLTAMATVRTTSGYSIYAGNIGGDVCLFDDSSSGAYNDLGSAYSVQMRTNDDDYGASGVTKGLGDTLVTIQPGGDYNPTLTPLFNFGAMTGSSHQIEMGDAGVAWGSGVYGSSVYGSTNVTYTDRLYTVGDGEAIAFEIGHASANEPFFIAKLTPNVQTHGMNAGEK